MTFYDYYTSRGQVDEILGTQIENRKKSIPKSTITQAKARDIANTLNMIFYPEKYGTTEADVENGLSQLSKSLKLQVLQQFTEEANKAIVAADKTLGAAINSPTLDKTANNSLANLKQNRARIHTQDNIQMSTLNKYRTTLENIMSLLVDGKQAEKLSKETKELVQRCENLLKQFNKLMTKNELTDNNTLTRLVMKGNKVAGTVDINALITFEQAYNNLLSSVPGGITTKDVGTLLEQALTTIGGNMLLSLRDDATNDLMSNFIKNFNANVGKSQKTGDLYISELSVGPTVTKDGKQISRGVMTKLDYDIPSANGDTLATIKIMNEWIGQATAARQGKVDVQIQMPDGEESMNISAKSWHGLWYTDRKTGQRTSKGFGSSPLLNILVRELYPEGMAYYTYAIGDIENREINKIHKYAKWATVLDILLGASQGDSAANLIIINDTDKEAFYVFSLEEILNKLTDDLSIPDYDSQISSVESYAQNMRKIIRKRENKARNEFYASATYLNAVEKLLHFKVEVRYIDVFDEKYI